MKYSVTTIVKQKVVKKVNEVKEDLTKKKQQLIADAGGKPIKKKLVEVLLLNWVIELNIIKHRKTNKKQTRMQTYIE